MSPRFFPLMARPSGDFSEKTSISRSAPSREPSRNVRLVPATTAFTTIPGSTTPSSAGGSPIRALRSRSVSWAILASCFPCSSRAAW